MREEKKKQIRVAWLFPSLARGYYWQPVFKEFARQLPETTIFTGLWPGFAHGYENAFKVQTLSDVRFVTLKKRRDGASGGYVRTPLSALTELAKFKPDVVFTNGFHGFTVCALLLRLIRGMRVVIFWEGNAPNSIGTSRIRAVTRRLISRMADAAVSNAGEGIRYLCQLGMPEEKVLCHPCEVPEMSLLCSGDEHAPFAGLKRPVFLYVGSIIPRKGWNHLVDATSLLVRQGFKQFSVVLAGSGVQEEELRSAIRENGLEGIVRPIGSVQYHKLGAYYKDADVFVSPTREDTWGVAVLEGMAFGKAVLCSKYAGSRQMINHGKDGFIFDPYNTTELAECMKRFIVDPDFAAAVGQRAREKMAQFTPARAASVLAKVALQPA
jgi:glycosyltransferase involved in cell wall biosynthesis